MSVDECVFACVHVCVCVCVSGGDLMNVIRHLWTSCVFCPLSERARDGETEGKNNCLFITFQCNMLCQNTTVSVRR